MIFEGGDYTEALLAAAEAVHKRGPQDRRYPVVLFELGVSKRVRGYAVALYPEFRGIADTVAAARAAGREEVLDREHRHVKAIAVLGQVAESYVMDAEQGARWAVRRPAPSGTAAERRRRVLFCAERIAQYADRLLLDGAGAGTGRWRYEQIKKTAQAIVNIVKGA